MGLILPYFFDCTIAIGLHDSGSFRGIASGFLFGEFLKKEKDEKTYRVHLVTNRHVFEGLPRVFVRCNPQKPDVPARDYALDLTDKSGKPLWVAHPKKEIDVAATFINMKVLEEQKMQTSYFASDAHVADVQKMSDLGVMEGDGVYILGFPMGIIGSTRSRVIARKGIIAQMRDVLSKDASEYLIDAFVFPGNSGGPVILKPELAAITGTKSQSTSYLIGIVSSYLPYRDEAVSKQTGKTRVIFEENSGLALVHPMDFVRETIEMIHKNH